MSAVVAAAPASASSPPAAGGGDAPSTPPRKDSAPTPASPAPGVSQAGQPTAPVPPEPKFFERTFKMNGKEAKVRASEEDLWNAYRHRESLGQRAREVAEQRKEFESQMAEQETRQRMLLEDPFLLLREQSPEFDEVDYLTKQLHQRLSQMPQDPREAGLMRREAELRHYEHRQAVEQERAKTAAQQALDEKELNAVGAFVMRALEQTKLPKDDVTLDLMGKIYFRALEDGVELTEAEAGKLTFDAAVEQQNAILAAIPDSEVLDRFPAYAQRIHRALVTKFTAQQAEGQPQPPAPKPSVQPPTIEERKTEAEAHKDLERQTGRRFLRTL